MILSNIKLRTNKILVQPEANTSSSFSTESRKYDRKSIAYVKGVGDDINGLEVGDKVIYDDSHSIDFTIDGVSLSIITPEDIAAKIVKKED